VARILCEKGHLYDPNASASCPTCAEDKQADGMFFHEAPGADFHAEPQPGPAMGGARVKTEVLETAPRGTAKHHEENGRTEIYHPGPGEEMPPGNPTGTVVKLGNHAGVGRTFEQSRILPVVGWLVIVNGAGTGRDFRLVPGQNAIGREKDMQICLDFGPDSDRTVSRREHAIIAYTVKGNEFRLLDRTQSSNLPCLNGETVWSPTPLKAMDIIQVGNTDLMFIPLCGEAFRWDSEKSGK
jgi:hypothetical protein